MYEIPTKGNKQNKKYSIIDSEDKVFKLVSSLIPQKGLKIDETRRWFRMRCSDDKYYKLFNHLLNFYFEPQYVEFENIWAYDIYNRHEAKIRIIRPEFENSSFYSFSVSDFCKWLSLDFPRFENALTVIGISSSDLEFSDKIVKFKVQKFIDSFDIVMSDKGYQVFLMVATIYAKKFVSNKPQQTYKPKTYKPREEKSKPIKIIYTPFGGQNGKKHH